MLHKLEMATLASAEQDFKSLQSNKLPNSEHI